MTLKITESSEIVQGWMYSKAPTSIHEALNIHRQLSKIVLSFKFSKFPCRSERKIFIEISARQRYWQRRLLPLLIARCTMMRLCFPIEHLLLKPEVHPEDQPANLPTCQPANLPTSSGSISCHVLASSSLRTDLALSERHLRDQPS